MPTNKKTGSNINDQKTGSAVNKSGAPGSNLGNAGKTSTDKENIGYGSNRNQTSDMGDMKKGRDSTSRQVNADLDDDDMDSEKISRSDV